MLKNIVYLSKCFFCLFFKNFKRTPIPPPLPQHFLLLDEIYGFEIICEELVIFLEENSFKSVNMTYAGLKIFSNVLFIGMFLVVH